MEPGVSPVIEMPRLLPVLLDSQQPGLLAEALRTLLNAAINGRIAARKWAS
jgi:hypothetical protein